MASNIPVKSTGFSLWTGAALVLAGVVVNAVSTAPHIHAICDLNEGRDVAVGALAYCLGHSVECFRVDHAAQRITERVHLRRTVSFDIPDFTRNTEAG